MRRVTPFLWAIAVVLALGLGIYAGHKVTAAYKDAELAAMRAKMEQANEDLAFWQATLRRVVEGDQVTKAMTGRVSKED
jgi:uncharacterized protein HemX